MGHIAIRLNPRVLKNPDGEIRHRIPALVFDATNGRVRDNGYDYTDGDVLVIYLSCDHPDSDVLDVVETLRANEVCENQLLDSAVIGISVDACRFTIVHPQADGGEFEVRPW